MSKSIIQSDKVCYICGYEGDEFNFISPHHCFLGNPNRKNSEKYGLKVNLCRVHHTDSPTGVHHNAELMQFLHGVGQKAFEEKYGTREEFRRIFGKSYL